MATVNLGNIKFKWKGTYNGATAYTIDDVVEYNGSSYICKLASTGNLPTNTTYFDVMSQAGTNGTNGTDVGTVITTQGDLLYRDGSGLQRLGAGTAGQYLQTGGAGANPSWNTVSSEMVKLASVSSNSSVGSIDLDATFDDSTYYEYIVKGVLVFASNGTTRVRVRQGGVTQTASNYDYMINYSYYEYGAGSGNSYGIATSQSSARMLDWDTRGANYPEHFWFRTSKLQDTTFYKNFAGSSCVMQNNNGTYMFSDNTNNWFFHANTNAITGFHFVNGNGGNIEKADIAIYGMKK